MATSPLAEERPTECGSGVARGIRTPRGRKRCTPAPDALRRFALSICFLARVLPG